MEKAFRTAACLALLLTVAGAASAQTVLIVTLETRDGELVSRPYASQEGFMSAMFDFGYISFDTGPYEPAVDWENEQYRELLDIAADGLADFVAVARIDSRVEGAPRASDESGWPLQVSSRVRFELLEVSGRSLGKGQFAIGSGGALDYDQPSDYRQALFQAGEALARECLRMLTGTAPRR